MMGFRTGAFAKVWEVTPRSDTSTKIRMTVSRKNKQTGEYETDFSGFVMCIGTAAARSAARLNKGDSIRLGDCDVSTKYDAEKKITYTNYKLFSFEDANGNSSNTPQAKAAPKPRVDEGEFDESRLPF